MHKILENTLEKFIFASRWLLAPIYVILSISLFFITIKVLEEFISFIPVLGSSDLKDMMLFILHIIDLALVANLTLMIIFSGYENFVSRISIADGSEDKPDWMGTVDFSELIVPKVFPLLTFFRLIFDKLSAALCPLMTFSMLPL